MAGIGTVMQTPIGRGVVRQQLRSDAVRASQGNATCRAAGHRNRGWTGGGLPGLAGEANSHVRFGVELLLGWLVVSLVVWAVLAFTIAVAPPGGSELEAIPYEIWQPGISDDPLDLSPSDPLVFCEVFATHTRCIREVS